LLRKLSLAVALLAPVSFAGVIGQTITGSLQFNGGGLNYFSPANGFVPASGYLNSGASATVVAADPAIEWGYSDGSNTDSADFTPTQLIIGDFASNVNNNAPATYSFTSANSGVFTSISLASNNHPGYSSVTLVGNVITVSFVSVGIASEAAGTQFTTTFNVNAVPEPATFAVAGAALAGLIVWRRRRARAH